MDKHISLQALYQDPTFSQNKQHSDTHLKTDDGTIFEIYSESLSRKSQFFNILFSINEDIGQSTVIRGIEPGVLEIILIYLYTGWVKITTENMLDLMVASDFLMLEPLLNDCKNFVLRNKTIENCVTLFLTAYRIKGLDIQDKLRRFLLICFEKAVQHSPKDAYNLPKESLKYVLSHRSLNISGESTVWSFIEAWVQNDPTNRLAYVYELLKCLSINEVDDNLASEIISSPIVRKNKLCEDQALQFRLHKSKADTAIGDHNPFITSVRQPRCLYFVTKSCPRNGVSEVFVSYDDRLDFCGQTGQLSVCGVRLLRVDNQAYVLRELGIGRCVFAGLIYDLLSNEMRDMDFCPSDQPIVVAEALGRVYALETNARNVYRYVDETDVWVNVNPMQRMVVQAAVGLNSFLYVVGNTGRSMAMQVYNPSTDGWKSVPPPTVPRSLTTAVVYQGKIFLLGGRYTLDDDDHQDDEGFDDDVHDFFEDFVVIEDAVDDNINRIEDDVDEDDMVSSDVEVFDPVEGEWTLHPELPFQCKELVTAVVNERLYVYNSYQSAVAYWDGSGKWKVVDCPSTQSEIFRYRFCAVEGQAVVRKLMEKNKSIKPSVWEETSLEKQMEWKC